MDGNRWKRLTLLLLALGGAIGLLTAVLPWVSVTHERLPDGGIAASASVANPPTIALSLAALAAVAALAIAGRFFRIVLGVLMIAVGAFAGFTAVTFDRAAAVITVAQDELRMDSGTVARILAEQPVTETATPWLALGAGVLIVGGGIGALVTGAAWPDTGRRYSTTTFAEADCDAALPVVETRVDQWDALSAGDDPTLLGETPDDADSK